MADDRDWKPFTGQKIERLYAWVAVDTDGGEGIMGLESGSGWMPMIGADGARIESLRPIAEKLATAAGVPYRLVLFSQRTDLESHGP